MSTPAHVDIEAAAAANGWTIRSQDTSHNLPNGTVIRQTFAKDGVSVTAWYAGGGYVTVASVAHPGDNKATKFTRKDLKNRVIDYLTNC